jgi:hypothetical protein
MLWVDRSPITAGTLQDIDPEITKVARASQLDLPGDGGVIQQAMQEAAIELLVALRTFDMYYGAGDLSGPHLAAVYNTGGGSPGVRAGLRQIIVDHAVPKMRSNVELWLQARTLAYFYLLATNRGGPDRYEDKYKEWQRVSWARFDALSVLGVPVVSAPLPCPGAEMELDPGAWSAAAVIGAGNAGTHVLAVTYVGVGASNNESAPSTPLTVITDPAEVVQVDIAGLTPRTEPIMTSFSGDPVAQQVSGWNVYAGPTDEELRLQNATPIAFATKTFTFPADPVTTGRQLGRGQLPTRMLLLQRMMARG